jgi:hypothetical protein
MESLFESTTSWSGGAISCSGHLALYVEESTFVDTTADRGGAIDHRDGGIHIGFCCFDSTRAVGSGTAIQADGASAKSIASSTFVNCQGEEFFAEGTVWLLLDTSTIVETTNFSQCSLEARSGFVLYLEEMGLPSPWSFWSCTVLKCSGSSGLYNWGRFFAPVSFCNFYGQTDTDFDGVLCGTDYGMDVSFCIFRDNSREFGLRYSDPSQKFAVSNCVFSGSLPSSSIYASTTGNLLATVTASHQLDHLSSCYYRFGPPQSPPPSASPISTKMASATPVETATPLKTATPLATKTPTDSDGLGCRIFASLVTQTTLEATVCVEVVNSYFGSSSAPSGGALLCSGYLDLYVQLSTFVNTSASSSGGAIEHSGGFLEVFLCCFDSTVTTTWGYGTAISLRMSGARSIEISTFINCHAADQYADATVYIYMATSVAFASANFSECHMADGWAFALTCEYYDKPLWSFSSCTVFKCSGRCGIENYAYVVAPVSFCNFYNLSGTEQLGVFYASPYGLNISFCIFRETSRVFSMSYPDAIDPKFQIWYCVFSSSQLPTDLLYDATIGNRFGTVTSSFALDHVSSCYYPPQPSATPGRSRTSAQTAMLPPATPARTPPPTPTLPPETPAPTPPPTPTSSPILWQTAVAPL